MTVRRASTGDIHVIVDFIAEEAREAEGRSLDRETLHAGIGAAIEDQSLAQYWLLVDDVNKAWGCISVVREWSDWNAGFYWWIQSLYIAPERRGMGCLGLLVDTVAAAAREADCLELRLYVHRSNEAAKRAYQKAAFDASPYLVMTKAV